MKKQRQFIIFTLCTTLIYFFTFRLSQTYQNDECDAYVNTGGSVSNGQSIDCFFVGFYCCKISWPKGYASSGSLTIYFWLHVWCRPYLCRSGIVKIKLIFNRHQTSILWTYIILWWIPWCHIRYPPDRSLPRKPLSYFSICLVHFFSSPTFQKTSPWSVSMNYGQLWFGHHSISSLVIYLERFS